MEKIPTAEDFMLENLQSMDQTEVEHAMIEFAKLHVKAALKEVWNNSEEWENGLRDTIRVIENDEDSILNSYSLENIK